MSSNELWPILAIVWEESLKRLKEKDVSYTLNDFIV